MEDLTRRLRPIYVVSLVLLVAVSIYSVFLMSASFADSGAPAFLLPVSMGFTLLVVGAFYGWLIWKPQRWAKFLLIFVGAAHLQFTGVFYLFQAMDSGVPLPVPAWPVGMEALGQFGLAVWAFLAEAAWKRGELSRGFAAHGRE